MPGRHGGRFFSTGWEVSRLGHFWDLAFLVLAGGALAGRLTTNPAARRLHHPAVHTAVAVLAAAQAYLLLDVALIPLLVLAAAVVLCYDAVHTGLAARARDLAAERLAAVDNPTTTGLALCLVALLLSWAFPGRTRTLLGGAVVLGSDLTGTAWAVVLILAAAAAIAVERKVWTTPYDAWVTGGVTLLFTAWAIVVFNLSLVPLLWAAGATVATYAQLRAARERTDGAVSLRRLTIGPRRLVLLGVPLCLVAMSFSWSKTSSGGYFMGGSTTTFSSYYGGYVRDYDFTKYYLPGFSYSGSGFNQGPSRFSFSPLVVVALLALVVLALWVSAKPVPPWGYLLPGALVAVVGLWALVHLFDGEFGPVAFLPGLALLATAAFTVALPTVRDLSAARAPSTT